MSSLRQLLLATVMLLPMACERKLEPGERKQEPLKDPIIAHIELDEKNSKEAMWMHNYQSDTKDRWMVETWMLGSVYQPSSPVTVFIRLTPQDHETKASPKSQVRLELAEVASKFQQEKRIVPKFEACSRMEPRVEFIFDRKTGNHGPRRAFPPREQAWQTRLEDPFNNGRRAKGKYFRLPYGNYVLTQEIILEKGPRFVFRVNLEVDDAY